MQSDLESHDIKIWNLRLRLSIDINIKKELQGSLGKMDLDINLTIKEHDFLAISGQSGSGKTTLLRILAGLEESYGEIIVSNETWLNEKIFLVPQKRKIGFVYQDYALFNNMSVEDNLLFVNQDKTLAKHLLEITELDGLKKRVPSSLSGGQKQRVSLCRAFMNRPKILLLDEPLSALDSSMRRRLQQNILTLHREFGTTTLMVSHDGSEIYKLANRIIELKNGKIINDGATKDILLKTEGSQKFSLRGELLDIIKADIIYIAIISIGQQIVEVVLDEDEANSFKIGENIQVSTKAFSPSIHH